MSDQNHQFPVIFFISFLKMSENFSELFQPVYAVSAAEVSLRYQHSRELLVQLRREDVTVRRGNRGTYHNRSRAGSKGERGKFTALRYFMLLRGCCTDFNAQLTAIWSALEHSLDLPPDSEAPNKQAACSEWSRRDQSLSGSAAAFLRKMAS